MPTRFIVTGGTIDKVYDPFVGLNVLHETHLPEMLEQIRYRGQKVIEVVMMKDSLEMNDADRDVIDEACDQAAENRIIVTHGTDTMPETARVLAQNRGLARKTIVLTGAMVPFTARNSDALGNLGAAVTASRILEPGVYVAMNGRVFPGETVRKDRDAGIFFER